MHLAFLLSGVLVGNFSSVVLVLAGSMGDGWKDLSVGRRIRFEDSRVESGVDTGIPSVDSRRPPLT